MYRKTYRTETFPFKRMKNYGEVDAYYVEESHPAIIDRATFEAAQTLRQETETGEVEFDDLANLINHMANRAKFLLMCLRDNRYDILNLVVQYAHKEKSEQIDTLFCFDTVEPDDGGVIGYYRTLTDKDAYYEKYGDGCIPAFAGKERMRDLGLSDDEDDFDEDEVEDELDEPLVERDFEG